MAPPDSQMPHEACSCEPVHSSSTGQPALFPDQAVNWMPWGDQTFEHAAEANKPVLLSIGYSTCDWCLRMARESFSDADIAALLNEHFVCISVNRELRPDIDSVYQTLHLLLNGRAGGWPLTLFLCPRKRLPFVAGTFFPRTPSAKGEMGFKQLLKKVLDYYNSQSPDCQRLLRQVEESLRQVTSPAQASPLMQSSQVSNALSRLDVLLDKEHGGFGSHPKFTLPVNLLFLLHMHELGKLTDDQRQHLQKALVVIAERGINDRVGGGFFRYATDSGWHFPSFEKMLYDNGLLLEVYSRAWLAFEDQLFQSSALGIVRWLKNHMLSPGGAFFSAQNSGSGEFPGSYYRYHRAELEAVLDAQEWQLFQRLFDAERAGAAEPLHLSQGESLNEAAEVLQVSEQQALQWYVSARAKLESLRQSRPPPRVEPLILVSANALAIKGLAVAARFKPNLLSQANAAIDFIEREMWIHQRLFASWRGGMLGKHAYLDDYANLIDALLEILQTRWRGSDYRLAMALAETLLHLHNDDTHGGFCYTANDAESLVYRHKPFMDSIQPAANGVAAKALLRLGHLCGEPRYVAAAEQTLQAAAMLIQHSPGHHLTLVEAHAEYLQPLPRVLIMDDGSMSSWEHEIRQLFAGRAHCFRLTQDAESYPPDALGMDPGEAIVCNGDECSETVTRLSDLIRLIREYA